MCVTKRSQIIGLYFDPGRGSNCSSICSEYDLSIRIPVRGPPLFETGAAARTVYVHKFRKNLLPVQPSHTSYNASNQHFSFHSPVVRSDTLHSHTRSHYSREGPLPTNPTFISLNITKSAAVRKGFLFFFARISSG